MLSMLCLVVELRRYVLFGISEQLIVNIDDYALDPIRLILLHTIADEVF